MITCGCCMLETLSNFKNSEDQKNFSLKSDAHLHAALAMKYAFIKKKQFFSNVVNLR